jgi:hypothetical protein
VVLAYHDVRNSAREFSIMTCYRKAIGWRIRAHFANAAEADAGVGAVSNAARDVRTCYEYHFSK